jgi:predicted ATP-binding protein involved in virulence
MYISNVSLKNFRKAKSSSINLDKRLNVFTGKNCSGKSTIFDAISILMSCFQGKPICVEKYDIRNGQDNVNLNITLNMNGKELKWDVSDKKTEHILIDDDFTFLVYYNDLYNFINLFSKLELYLKNKTVSNVVKQFMNGFMNFDIVNNDPITIKKDGKLFTIKQLSQAEKRMIAMISDLTYNVSSFNDEGIIMMDEIDTYLHPSWQKLFIPQLLKVFPNCQFIFSTNSPNVINQIQPENLFIFDANEDEIKYYHPSNSYGKTVERILEDIMGLKTTRPDEIHKTLNMIYEYIDNGDLSHAKHEITKLEKIIGSDSELTKANVLIKLKETINK